MQTAMLTLPCFLCLLSGCSFMFPTHADSNVRGNEQVTLKFSIPGLAVESLPAAPPIAAIVPEVVGYAIDHVATALDNEAALYTASYGATIALVSRTIDK